MNELPAASRPAVVLSCSALAGSTDWNTGLVPVGSSFSMLRTIQPGKARVTGGDPWIDVTPPTTAFTSAKRSAAAGAAMPSAWAGLDTSRW